jgi:hypothetical protein
MKLTERDDGDYRIYAGAMEGPHGDGFIAAVVVRLRRLPAGAEREVWREDALSCGHRWPTQESALAHAVVKGREAVARVRDTGLACTS